MAAGDDGGTERTSARSSPFGQERAGLRLRLARAAVAGADGEPFVLLRSGAGSRTYLGEVVTEAGAVLQRFQWKVRVDDDHGSRSNAEVDDAWRRERETLARVRSPFVSAPFPVPAAVEASAPLWWCLRLDRGFAPVSPQSGEPLRTCRDDATLQANGLPAYADASVRHLHDGRPGTPLYTSAATATTRTVRTARDLVRDWAPMVRGEADDAVTDRAAAIMPCIDCRHRGECWPGDTTRELPAERELRFVSFHDVEALALEHHDLDWDDACALLGGAGLDEWRRVRPVADVALGTSLRGDGQWLFAEDPVRGPLEKLRAKLLAFRDLCAGTAAVHATGRPHLGLVPANVRVDVATGARAPVRWQFGVRLGGLGSALPVVLPGGVAGTGFHLGAFYEPGPDVRGEAANQPFLPLGMRSGTETATTVPVACWRTGATDGLCKLVVEVQAAAFKTSRVGDLVVVRPVTGGPALVARVDEARPRGLLASALLGPNDPCLQWDGGTFDAALTFHRRFGPAADLAPLGALLVRAVLVDDQQPLDAAVLAVAQVLRAFADEPTGVRADVRSAALCLQSLLQHPDVRARLDSAHVLHKAADRSTRAQQVAAGTPAVPPRLWLPVLTIVARLLSNEAPFAYAGDLADSATTAMQNLDQDLGALLRALDVELFFTDARDAAIAAACADARDELAESGGAGEATPKRENGFRLVLARDGDARTQELVYHVPRVTIGRREGDNVLRLQDPMVSSNHAVIEADGDGFSVSDRNSTNGTEVDGIRLPVDVPQPLADGSVLRIRPFKLTFHLLTPGSDPTLGAAARGRGAVLVPLAMTHAQAHGKPAAAMHETLCLLLRQVRLVVGGKMLHAVLQDARFAASQAPTAGTGSAVGSDLLLAAQSRALQQIARSLVPGQPLDSPELVQQFASRLAKFVEGTSQWIERTLELKKVLGKHLEFGLASTAGGRTPVRTAAEVRVAALGADADPANVARFLDGITDVLAGLLRGNRRVRAAVRERLDPPRLVQAAGRDAAATSALWQAYERAFREVTGDGAADAELDALLARVLPEK
jgi:hypothetical protein